tara:strand:+ start:930 stop:1400 length:471 start_codon:yes stop_codon:yes gene_type:complete
MSQKFLKILLVLLLFVFIQSCGYEPLLTEKNKKFSINSFDISGERKLGQMLVNNFIKVKNSENILMCKMNINKERFASNKDRSGKIIEYTLNVNLDLEITSILDTNSVLTKSYSEKRSYKASNLYSDTISREKKISQDLIKSIADQINNDLNLIYK